MGRPIRRKFFNPYNITSGGPDGSGAVPVDIAKSFGVASIAVAGGSLNYSTLTTITLSAPNIPGGVQATASVTIFTSTGIITATSVVTTGSGYTQLPTVTVNNGGTGTGAVFTLTLTTLTLTKQIKATAWVTGDTTSRNADIIKQEGTKRYLVETSKGTSICKLTTGTITTGTMTIIATDINSSTYFVTRLTGRKARLYRQATTTTFVFATNALAKWTTASNVLLTTSSVVSIAVN